MFEVRKCISWSWEKDRYREVRGQDTYLHLRGLVRFENPIGTFFFLRRYSSVNLI